MFLSGLSATYLLITVIYAFPEDFSLSGDPVLPYFVCGLIAFTLSTSVLGFCLWIDKRSFFLVPSYKIKPLMDAWIPLWAGGILVLSILTFGYFSHWEIPLFIGGFIAVISIVVMKLRHFK